jgi:DNA mismatch endonuclease (patch repair protein)
MAANRGRTKPERLFATAIWRAGRRFFTSEGYAKLSGRKLMGSPDLVFPAPKVLVFVDGCFWHGCPRCQKSPPSMSNFWIEKISTNVLRDRRVRASLRRSGWRVIRVWEHELGSSRAVDASVRRVLRTIDARLNGEKC